MIGMCGGATKILPNANVIALMPKTVIALGGLPGCGKSEAIAYLQKTLDCPKVYFPQVVFDTIEKEGLEPSQDNERAIRERLREEHGMGVMATLSLPKVAQALEQHDTVLIESMYSWEEYLAVKEAYGDQFYFIAVYAPPRLRYARLAKRPERPLTAEQARERDYAQLTKLNQGGPIAIADYTIANTGTLTELHAQLDAVIADIP